MKFLYYDLIFLAAFCIFVFVFLRINRKKIQREGIVFLYRTKVGLKFIDSIAKKFKKILDSVGWVSIILGFIMMVLMFYLLIQTIILTAAIPMSAPPILPLFPYVPQAFNLPLPPFYFTYWIVIIVIIAVVHEFAHGIFARHDKIKVKSTGFGFLGPFLAAFVEPDEKQLVKKKNKQQLEIFSAGSFSNLVFAAIFMLILQLFFVLAYQPAGLSYSYAYNQINVSEIQSIGNYSIDGFLNLSTKQLAEINTTLALRTANATYYVDPGLIQQISQSKRIIAKYHLIPAYGEEPAFNAGLKGGIEKINGIKIKSTNDLSNVLSTTKPGDTITVETSEGTYQVRLAQNPLNSSKSYMGIYFSKSTILSSLTAPYFSPGMEVKSRGNEQTTTFFRDLLVWLVLIGFLVALFNMLPVGFLDGGRMFFILGLVVTGSKKKAKTWLTVASYIVLLIILAMLFVWIIG
jgi:membrane-associated protease RseP (regulator of RpoE activity)